MATSGEIAGIGAADAQALNLSESDLASLTAGLVWFSCSNKELK